MDLAVAAHLTPVELRKINLCRLHFNALTLSDVTNATGTRLLPGILDGTTLLSQSRTKGPAIKQPSPDSTSWGSWRKLFRRIADIRGTLHMHHRLGPWTVTGNDLRRSWPFLFSVTTNTLY
jgi:hypothetical protein